jgi:hypothetical protein
MLRTQVQFDEDDHRRLRAWAHDRNLSVAEAVRRAVGLLLEQEAPQGSRADLVRAALAVCGGFRDPGGPLALGRNHDVLVDEASTT